MTSINPYLNFPGNAEEAFTFYQSVFGGEFITVIRFKDMPMEGYEQLPEEEQHKIMHIALPVGHGSVLMASDTLPSAGQQHQAGNNFYLLASADSREEADRLFRGLSQDGSVEMPIADAPWGAYFGMLKDKFGTGWMVSYDPPKE